MTNKIFYIYTADWVTDERTGKQYIVQDTDDLVYDVNKQACQNLGGFLPEPRDEAENQFLDSLGSDMFTLGMTDRVVEGQWVWESDGSPVTWTGWVRLGTNDPEPVIVLRRLNSHYAGHRTDGWADIPCDSIHFVRSNPRSRRII